MTECTDKNVLMRCERCGYLEYVPEKELQLIAELPPHDEEDHILCPFCLNDMYRADSPRFQK